MKVMHNQAARCEAQRLGFSGVWLEGEDLLADAMRKRATQRRQRAAQERLEIKARARVGVGGSAGGPGGSLGGLGKHGAAYAGSDSSDTEEEQDPKFATPGQSPGKLSIDVMTKTPGKEVEE